MPEVQFEADYPDEARAWTKTRVAAWCEDLRPLVDCDRLRIEAYDSGTSESLGDGVVRLGDDVFYGNGEMAAKTAMAGAVVRPFLVRERARIEDSFARALRLPRGREQRIVEEAMPDLQDLLSVAAAGLHTRGKVDTAIRVHDAERLVNSRKRRSYYDERGFPPAVRGAMEQTIEDCGRGALREDRNLELLCLLHHAPAVYAAVRPRGSGS